MSEQIKFRIVLLRSGHGMGEAVSPDSDVEISYGGEQMGIAVTPNK